MPPPENACSPKSIRARSASAQAIPMGVSIEPPMDGKDCVETRGKGWEDSGEWKGGAAAKKEAGVCMKEKDAVEGIRKAGPMGGKPSAAEANEDDRGKKGKGDDIHGKHGVKNGGEADKVEVTVGKAISDGVTKEALKENAEGEGGASGDGKGLAKRQRIGAFLLRFVSLCTRMCVHAIINCCGTIRIWSVTERMLLEGRS